MDGQQAIDTVQSQANNYFSMIVLDINMPGKNGIQACTEILNHFEQGVEDEGRGGPQRLSSPQYFGSGIKREQELRQSKSDKGLDYLRRFASVKKNI